MKEIPPMKKTNLALTVDLRLHAQVDMLRVLRWLVPVIALALKLALGSHAGLPA